MSRPFSYNDENFTVIGNVLFVHVRVLQQVDANGVIATIPQAIYDRLLQKSCYAIVQRQAVNTTGLNWSLKINKNAELITTSTISAPTINNAWFFTAFLFLKDI